MIHPKIENGEQLQSTIAELEATIENQDNEANVAIAQWEVRCNTLSEQIAELEHALNDDDITLRIKELEDELLIKQGAYKEAFDKNTQLSTDLQTKNKEIEELKVIQQTFNIEKEKHKDMASIIQNLSDEKAVALDQLDKEMFKSKQVHDTLENEQRTKVELESKLLETKELLEKAVETQNRSELAKMEIERMLDEDQQKYETQIQTLEDERRYLEESNEIDRAEANEMRLIIGQLESELKEANDMLQSHLTDEVSARATEMATNALRTQLKESREKQSYGHEAYICEKDARQAAEEEVEKLKSDLALLLQVDNFVETSDARMHQLTSKAAGEVMEREREEIDALTKSLQHLMKELQSCQSKEREAEERAANSRLHASACEQELFRAKSDISLLKDSIESSKRDESNMRSSLESRVKSLELEREAIMQSHGTETKNLKAEISQSQMERERLIHALNESEKANSALVYSTSVDQGGNDSPIELELAKLRLEKAQLLAAVQVNSSKVEQRIRNVFSGGEEKNESSEKELIEAAEKSLKGLQQKYDETSAQLVIANTSNTDLLNRLKEANVGALKNDLYRLETDVSKLQKMNEELQAQLTHAENEAKTTNITLEEKCRLADAKIRELERQERKEASLAAEIARMRDETLVKKSSNSDDGGASESKDAAVGADDMHDFVLELKEAVKEERKMYHDLLAEHEDLLALLAQQDLEKTSLQAALLNTGGHDAVDKAILEAEEQANEQFGRYIKLK